MRYLSLFSGIEAASVAWTQLDWECAGVSEILEYQSNVIKMHYPDIKNFGDVTKITEDDIKSLGKLDIVIFGSPCQDMSVAGKRQGLETIKEDTNHSSILFFEGMRVFRLAQKHCGARFLVWENVPGALSSNEGADFGKILSEMVGVRFNSDRLVWGSEGVCVGDDSMCEWAVLDAQWFGVAQRRRRLFVVLDTGDWGNRSPILLESDCLRGNSPPSRKTGKAAPDKIEESSGETSTFDMQAIGEYGISGVGSTIKARDYKDATDLVVETQRYTCAVVSNIIGRNPETRSGGNGTGFNEEVMYTMTGADHHAVAYSFDSMSSNSMKSNNPLSGCNEVHISKTIDTSGINPSCNQGGIGVLYESHVRRLTPLECERLQGFPDNWADLGETTFGKRINALGRSMAVPVIKWIGSQIENCEK